MKLIDEMENLIEDYLKKSGFYMPLQWNETFKKQLSISICDFLEKRELSKKSTKMKVDKMVELYTKAQQIHDESFMIKITDLEEFAEKYGGRLDVVSLFEYFLTKELSEEEILEIDKKEFGEERDIIQNNSTNTENKSID